MFRCTAIVVLALLLSGCATLANEVAGTCDEGYELVCDDGGYGYGCTCKEAKDSGEPDPSRRG